MDVKTGESCSGGGVGEGTELESKGQGAGKERGAARAEAVVAGRQSWERGWRKPSGPTGATPPPAGQAGPPCPGPQAHPLLRLSLAHALGGMLLCWVLPAPRRVEPEYALL